MYARMLIGEAISEEQMKEFTTIYHERIEPALAKEPGFRSAELLIEEGGKMLIALTVWDSREDCLRYHSSRSYRQSVAEIQHLFIGDQIVKLFKLMNRDESTTGRKGENR